MNELLDRDVPDLAAMVAESEEAYDALRARLSKAVDTLENIMGLDPDMPTYEESIKEAEQLIEDERAAGV